jgi:hypothetical protein
MTSTIHPPSFLSENDSKRDLLADSKNERLSEKEGSNHNKEKSATGMSHQMT